MKVRIRFEKDGALVYVGHLDIMRYFQKAFRRSGLPIKYSEGFNPHPVMSFAQPLGLGVSSSGEYMDIEVTEAVDPEEGINRLAKEMTEGLRIASWHELPDDAKNAMASVAAASYRLTYADPAQAPSTEQLKQALSEEILGKTEIPYIKETKKGTRELDLKPLIYEIALEEGPDGICWTMCISASSADAIKPQMVLDVIHRSLELEPANLRMHIHRTDLYAMQEGKLVSLENRG